MIKKILISVLTLSIILCTYTSSLCIEKDNKYSNDIWINNINEDDIKIKVLDVEVVEEEININEKYSSSAILTMKVENNSVYDVELSNINISPYQGDNPIKYFVSTSEDNITGFIGNLRSKDSKTIKMGVTLHDTNDPIKLEISNIEDLYNEKVIESINLK